MQKTALISVYDKTGIDDFARALVELGWRIVSSGGTAKALVASGISVIDVAEITGLPAILGHRVVTLAPQIHGGLLATEAMRSELQDRGWPWLDLVCLDFYPLEAESRRPGATIASVLDNRDIGGPTMAVSAAKGRRIVIVKPDQRATVLAWLRSGEPDPDTYRTRLAIEAERTVAAYGLIAAEFQEKALLLDAVL